MLTPAYLRKFITENGPYVYHYTDSSVIDSVLARGLVPRTVRVPGRPKTWRGKWASRREHVYVKSEKRHTQYGLTKTDHGALFRVDVRLLDLKLIDSNEDSVGAVGWPIPKLPGHEQVAPNPKLKLQYVAPKDVKKYLEKKVAYNANTAVPAPFRSWGEWADAHTEIIDSPRWVDFSLRVEGTAAVRGGVPREAIVGLKVNPRSRSAKWRKT